jgi:tetratricopeptide (TPR) repeat protein
MIDRTAETVVVHRLVQAVLLSRQADTVPAETASIARPARDKALGRLLNVVPRNPGSEATGWPLWRSLIPHIDVLSQHYADREADEPLGRLLNRAAVFLASQGAHSQALRNRERALAIAEEALGPDHPNTTSALGNLALTYKGLGRPTEALPLAERALTITETALGPDHPDMAIAMSNLAVIYAALGRRDDAQAAVRRAYGCARASPGKTHPTTEWAKRLCDGLEVNIGAE